jgi:hypothetical protein
MSLTGVFVERETLGEAFDVEVAVSCEPHPVARIPTMRITASMALIGCMAAPALRCLGRWHPSVTFLVEQDRSQPPTGRVTEPPTTTRDHLFEADADRPLMPAVRALMPMSGRRIGIKGGPRRDCRANNRDAS